jgi:hypothetical protein
MDSDGIPFVLDYSRRAEFASVAFPITLGTDPLELLSVVNIRPLAMWTNVSGTQARC